MSACLRHCRRLCAVRHENILRPKTFSSGFKTSPADAALLTPRRAGKAILARQSGCGQDIWSAPCDALADVVSRTVAPFFSQMLCLERLGNFSTSLSRQPICRRPLTPPALPSLPLPVRLAPVIGDVKPGPLEEQTRAGAGQTFHFSAAPFRQPAEIFRAFAIRLVPHRLERLEGLSAFLTRIFVSRHGRLGKTRQSVH